MATDDDDPEVDQKVYTTFIRLAFTPYTIHFKSPKYMKEETLRRLDRKVVKETLRLTGSKGSVRKAIGLSRTFWEELQGVFRAGVTSLERRSFHVWDPTSVDYETTSSALIASAYPGIYKDLDRLNDLVAIARNVLVLGREVQDMCVDCGVDRQVLKFINCAVRVAARGYDGESGTGDEEKWQWVVNAYKKLLITSLQFLNNLSARNERRKILLWLALFDNEEGASAKYKALGHAITTENQPSTDPTPRKSRRSMSESDIYVAAKKIGQMSLRESTAELSGPNVSWDEFCENDELGKAAFARFVGPLAQGIRTSSAPNMSADDFSLQLREAWLKLPDEERSWWKTRYLEFKEDAHRFKEMQDSAKTILGVENHHDPVLFRLGQIEGDLRLDLKGDGKTGSNDLPIGGRLKCSAQPSENYRMSISAAMARQQLEIGKADLIKRITAHAAPEDASKKPASSPPNRDVPPPPMENVIESESGEESEEEEEDYHVPDENGRGLLTDVPLILGPSEIEILPNLIMSGLVPSIPPDASVEEVNMTIDVHAQRCRLLLAQENGRNLLRELLIFVAAWDLREEELYFKFMIKIVGSILVNGLIPYAYHCFRDAGNTRNKDIISPAQAVIMKLLTNIFRTRAETSKTALLETGQVVEPSSAEVHVVNFIFTEFRQRIVPQTCALIFLQGKIRENLADPEDFPLNLWDMERMYEGVYQYLEFFAVLTEEQAWKDIMAGWEVASELVTMLKMLEGAIPKTEPGLNLAMERKRDTPKIISQQSVDTKDDEAQQVIRSNPDIALTTQEMYNNAQALLNKGKRQIEKAVQLSSAPIPPLAPHSALNLSSSGISDDVANSILADAHNIDAFGPKSGTNDDLQDEPADFEWRNLKKLTVLVLSSLVWKNKTVQDQIRDYGGLEALISCCRPDEHNPYIREHAIMCLRFAIEGNSDNSTYIRDMAHRLNTKARSMEGEAPATGPGTITEIPKEVLDTSGYETFMDGRGQVGLRRKESQHKGSRTLQEAAAQAIQGAIAGTSLGKTKEGRITTKMAAEKAAQLMQNALQDLPLPASLDKDSRDIIARLNKAALEHVDLLNPGSSKLRAAKK